MSELKKIFQVCDRKDPLCTWQKRNYLVSVCEAQSRIWRSCRFAHCDSDERITFEMMREAHEKGMRDKRHEYSGRFEGKERAGRI
jgi:hypothetical protein